jgi:hypothetical protein
MSIKTGIDVGDSGNCRYSSTETVYTDMVNPDGATFTKIDGMTHTASLSDRTDGWHKFNVACHMLIGTNTYSDISGGESDAIIYAVDKTPPTTKLLYKDDDDNLIGYVYDSSVVNDTIHLELGCSDSYPSISDSGINGCKSLHYCVVSAKEYANTPNNHNCTQKNTDFKEFDRDNNPLKCENNNFDYSDSDNLLCKNNYGNSPYVCYYSEDNACNSEDIKCMRLNVRNTDITKAKISFGKTPVCQDGVIDRGEECDDGNNNNDDACKNDCICGLCLQYDATTQSCVPQAVGSDLKNECTDVFTCGGASNQYIMNSGVCDGAGACSNTPVNIATCTGDCDSYCVNGQSLCVDTFESSDPYNICLNIEGDCLTGNCGNDANCEYTPNGQNDGCDGIDGQPEGECDGLGNCDSYNIYINN